MRFTKMEGIGNDYIYINGFEERVDDPAELAVRMSRQHFGCGADGLILILPSEIADFRMRMFNNDGSEGMMCGNGIRCVARYCYDRGLIDKTEFTIEAGGKIKVMQLIIENGAVAGVRVDMGVPVLDGALIPSAFTSNPVINEPITVNGKEYRATLVNVGNPHAVIFVDDPETAPVCEDGVKLEHHPAFPERVNVEFTRIVSRDEISLRVWERGTGETLACGTGCCAALVAAVLNGYCGRRAKVSPPGGTLDIEWSEADGHVYMTGGATYVYDGVWLQAR